MDANLDAANDDTVGISFINGFARVRNSDCLGFAESDVFDRAFCFSVSQRGQTTRAHYQKQGPKKNNVAILTTSFGKTIRRDVKHIQTVAHDKQVVASNGRRHATHIPKIESN